MRSGLVSVTFRKLPAERIIELAGQAELAGIEWGGDVHVPHGDLARSRQVGGWTRDAGLAVAAYGSYYRAGEVESPPFQAVLDSARELGAPLIRVWAGRRASADADEAHWSRVIDDTRRIAGAAVVAGIGIVFEFHARTLTDTTASARRLLDAAGQPNVHSYWQPPAGWSEDDCLASLAAVRPRLAGLHVFQWLGDERRPLAEGESRWLKYLAAAGSAGDTFALLEFVPDDLPEAMLRDAAALNRWLRGQYSSRSNNV